MFPKNSKSTWLPVILYGLLALALSGFLLPFANYLTSDGVTYLRLAKNLFSGKGISVDPGGPYLRHPPFYSFLVGLANFIFRDMEFSGHLIPMLSFALTVIPLFLLAREIHSESSAHWTSFLYVTNGFLLCYSNLIMTEILFTLLLFIQLYFLHQLIHRDRLCYFLAVILGIAGGLGYLTRPEGLVFYLVGLACIFSLSPAPLGIKIRFTVLSSVIFLLFFLPYAAFVSKTTGHWQPSGMAREEIIKRQLDLAHPGQYLEIKKIYLGLTEDKSRLKINELVDRFSLFDYLRADDFALLRGSLYSLAYRIPQFNTYFFGGLGFFLVGASWMSAPWDSRRRRSELLLMAFVLPFLVYLFVPFYPRRFVPFFPIFLIGMGNGMTVLTDWLKKSFNLSREKMRWAIPLLGLALLGPSAWYLPHTLPKGDFPSEDRELGLWMKKNIPSIQEEKVAGQEGFFVNFYSGAVILRLPYVERFEDFLTYMARQKAKYFVVGDNLEEPVKRSYSFLLDDRLPPPPFLRRLYVLRGGKKMILYEIAK